MSTTDKCGYGIESVRQTISLHIDSYVDTFQRVYRIPEIRALCRITSGLALAAIALHTYHFAAESRLAHTERLVAEDTRFSNARRQVALEVLSQSEYAQLQRAGITPLHPLPEYDKLCSDSNDAARLPSITPGRSELHSCNREYF